MKSILIKLKRKKKPSIYHKLKHAVKNQDIESIINYLINPSVTSGLINKITLKIECDIGIKFLLNCGKSTARVYIQILTETNVIYESSRDEANCILALISLNCMLPSTYLRQLFQKIVNQSIPLKTKAILYILFEIIWSPITLNILYGYSEDLSLDHIVKIITMYYILCIFHFELVSDYYCAYNQCPSIFNSEYLFLIDLFDLTLELKDPNKLIYIAYVKSKEIFINSNDEILKMFKNIPKDDIILLIKKMDSLVPIHKSELCTVLSVTISLISTHVKLLNMAKNIVDSIKVIIE